MVIRGRLFTTRRAVLAGAASFPALAIIPAMAGDAGGADPIFAAIAKHKAAFLRSMHVLSPDSTRPGIGALSRLIGVDQIWL